MSFWAWWNHETGGTIRRGSALTGNNKGASLDGKEAESETTRISGQTSRWMALALVAAAVIFVLKFIAPQTIGEQARRHVESKFAEHYKDLDVSIGSGRFDPKVGLILDDIVLSVPEQSRAAVAGASPLRKTLSSLSQSNRELLRVRQIVLVTNARIDRLLDRQNPLVAERMIVRGVVANAWMSDGRVSLSSLWPPPKTGDTPCPRIEIRDANILLHSGDNDATPLELAIEKAVVLKHFAPPGKSDGTGAETQTREPTSVTSITALGSTAYTDRVELTASFRDNGGDIRANVTGARYSSELARRLPSSWREQLETIPGLSVSFDSDLALRLRNGQPIQFKTRTEITDGTFQHPSSPIPLSSIGGLITYDANGLRVQTAAAKWGDAQINIKSLAPLPLTWPLNGRFGVSVTNLMLDQRVASIIPHQVRKTWNEFQPRGLIDVHNGLVSFENGEIRTAGSVTCKGVDVSFEKFPYPVRSVTGTLSMENGRVKSELMSGWVGGRLMNCLFDLPTKRSQSPAGVFSIGMDGPVAIDAELLRALTPRSSDITQLESFVRSLNPLGSIHLTHATFRTAPDGSKHQFIELAVSDGTCRFQGFPYPLYNVRGDIKVENDLVTFSDFSGSNANGGTILCAGTFRIPPKAGNGPPSQIAKQHHRTNTMLDLQFSASRVALDQTLRNSLPHPSQRTWDAMWPSGIVDSLEIGLTIESAGDPLDLQIVGRQFESARLGNDALRLQPVSLPYRLDVTDGIVRYQNGQISVDSIRAVHGRSAVSAHGGCRQLPSGRWLLAMNLHTGSRLIPDEEFIDALPQEMRGAMRNLKLRGPVGFSGSTEILLSNETEPNPRFVWDLELQLEGNRIGDVGPVHSLRGELSMRGEKDVNGLRAQGDLRLDSLHVDELQITQLRGPYEIRDDLLLMGKNVPRGSANQSIRGRLFDGTLNLNGDVKLSDASYDVQIGLAGAKLPTLLADLGHNTSDLTGSLSASMTLEGLLGTTDLLRGKGRATIDDANLYQLPLLMRLLNVLSITPDEEVAFTNADIDFTMIEDQIRFSDLKIWGSLIALYGSGTMDRRHELDLTFNTRVSPRNSFTRILRPLSNQQYTLWTIDVKGPLNDPDIDRKALDGVGETLEKLFPGMNTGTESKRKDRTAGFGRMFQ